MELIAKTEALSIGNQDKKGQQVALCTPLTAEVAYAVAILVHKL